MASKPDACGGPGPGPLASARLVAEAVMLRHTLFSLPFALGAVLLETDGRPPLDKLLWIVLAATGGRNAANALNRIIDKDIDARNPRTAGRHLPAGRLTAGRLWVFTVLMLGLLVVSAFMLNWLCVILLPVAGVMVFGYSYTKRFTWLCHWWLGLTCAIATMGAFLGLSGRFEFRYFVLSGAVALWVAGFDVIYALQDMAFDRRERLHSAPARFGPGGARILAGLSHAGAALGFFLLPLFWPLGLPYLAAAGLAALLLLTEHLIALGGTERHIRIAAYGINELLPLVLLAGIAADIYL